MCLCLLCSCELSARCSAIELPLYPWLWASLPWGDLYLTALSHNIFYICIRIRLSKVVFVIQAKRIGCDSVFRKSSLRSPGQVESPYGNCCTHITRLRFLVELTQTELLTEVMQKFGQDFCPGLTPSSHLLVPPPAGLERETEG